MKSICQTLHGPLGIPRYPGAVQRGFPGLYFGQVEKVRDFLQPYFIPPPIQICECYHCFSVDKWFITCTVVRREVGIPESLVELQRNQSFLSTQQLLNFQSCFSLLRTIFGPPYAVFLNYHLGTYPFGPGQRFYCYQFL